MRISGGAIRFVPVVLAGLPALAGCGGIAHLGCDGVAEQALQLSRQRPIRILGIANVRETARTDAELRCAGDATLGDGGTTPLYLRAHEENGHIETDYQATPYP